MQKNYELLYIVHPDLEGSIEKITEKVAGFIVKAGGKVTSHEDLGKRKLAYKIAKNDFGIYSLVYFDVESTQLKDVERDLRLSEEIMRSMVVAVPVVSPVTLAKRKPRIKKEDVVVKKDAPASIIVAEDKPKKKVTKKTEEAAPEEVVEVKEVATEVAEKKPAAKKAPAKKTVKAVEKEEKERLKKLDDKLDELLK
jgi:small subunit ribosomal protein S6